MYQILLNSDKSLITTERINIYQRDKLIDKIQFIIPKKYQNFDLIEFTVYLKYVDQNSAIHTEILTVSNEDYKDDYFTCVLPLDTDLTRYAGDVSLRLQLSKYDEEAGTQYVLTSDETTFTVKPVSDIYEFIPDESLDAITQKIGQLDAKIAALDKISGDYVDNQVDDLEIDSETDRLYVTAKGERKGNGVEIMTGGDDGSEDGQRDGIITIDDMDLVEI